MIIGVGTDITRVNRFDNWHKKSKKQLLRIFSDQEIAYCLNDPTQHARRFAVRFAAREALYKALCYAEINIQIPFLTLCRYTTITKHNNVPMLRIQWPKLSDNLSKLATNLTTHISLAHEKDYAIAYVILSVHNDNTTNTY